MSVRATTKGTATKRVLIVDDEAIVLTVLRDFFASFRHGRDSRPTRGVIDVDQGSRCHIRSSLTRDAPSHPLAGHFLPQWRRKTIAVGLPVSHPTADRTRSPRRRFGKEGTRARVSITSKQSIPV